MKVFNWDSEKNDKLILERNISFYEIIIAIIEGNIIDVYDHPNQQQYPNQKIYAIKIDNYIYLVPFVERDDQIFLKTIIPSRKATKQYLGGNNE